MNRILNPQENGAFRKNTNPVVVEMTMCSSCIQNGFEVNRVSTNNKKLHDNGWPSMRVLATNSETEPLSRASSQWCASSMKNSWCQIPTRLSAKYNRVSAQAPRITFDHTEGSTRRARRPLSGR